MFEIAEEIQDYLYPPKELELEEDDEQQMLFHYELYRQLCLYLDQNNF